MRTLQIARDSGTRAGIYVVVNGFYAYGILDRQLVEHLDAQHVPVMAKVPRAVALSNAAARGVSVAEHDPRSHVLPALEALADGVVGMAGMD